MGTITARRRSDGTTGYTAQIRIKRDGKVVHSESETFDRQALAKEWMRRREAELDERRARGEPMGRSPPLSVLLDWYRTSLRQHADWGRTKEADLKRLEGYDLAKKPAAALGVADYIAHAEARRAEGAGPATVGNDLIWIRQVLRSARASYEPRVAVDLQLLDDAVHELRMRKVIAKSEPRSRRLSKDEERKLLEHFASRDARSDIPMVDIVRFALATSRRQDEITRLRWDDLRESKGTAYLDDVKHPRKKRGNRREFRMLSSAWEIVNRQPRPVLDEDGKESPFVFPYKAKSIGSAFTRACALLGIEDLTFHDLRHEATSRFFEMGYSIQEVAQFTLHESWATLKRYTHLRPEHVPER